MQVESSYSRLRSVSIPLCCPFSFVHLSFSHAFRWSTTNHNSLKFFTTPTGLTELSCLEGIILSQSRMPQLDKFTNSTLRTFLLITFSRAERTSLNKKRILERITKALKCTSILISKEEDHQQEGFHFHVGIRCRDSDKNKAAGIIKSMFSEFEEMQYNVQFLKWGNICHFITKVDMDFWVSGELSKEQILERANTFRKKKGRYLIKMVKIVKRAWGRPKDKEE